LLLLILLLLVPMLSKPVFGLGQELSAAFNRWDPHQGELTTSIRATYMSKSQEVERVRLLPGLPQVHPRKSPEAHDPRLFFCQFQSEFSEAIRQVPLELFRIVSVLEIHHEIICESRQVRLSLTALLDLLFEPEIKNEV